MQWDERWSPHPARNSSITAASPSRWAKSSTESRGGRWIIRRTQSFSSARHHELHLVGIPQRYRSHWRRSLSASPRHGKNRLHGVEQRALAGKTDRERKLDQGVDQEASAGPGTETGIWIPMVAFPLQSG